MWLLSVNIRILLVTNNLENFLAEEFWFSNECFIMLGVIHKNFWKKAE